MTELIELEETEYQDYKVYDMPSRNHSFVQTKIASMLFNDGHPSFPVYTLKYRSHALRGNAVGDASRHKNLNCSLLFR